MRVSASSRNAPLLQRIWISEGREIKDSTEVMILVADNNFNPTQKTQF
jgi:hypothetical protein